MVEILGKNRPSRAIAKYTRGAVKIHWLKKPRAEIQIAIDAKTAPECPTAASMALEAGVVVELSTLTPKARTQTYATPVYSTITPATPMRIPGGMSRSGLRSSPFTNPAVCQPPYENN